MKDQKTGNGKRRGKRGKGCGTLEYRPRKGYLARWTVDGVRFSENLGKIPKEEAERRLKEITSLYRTRNELERAERIQGKVDGVRRRLEILESARPSVLIANAFEEYEKSPERPDTAAAGRLGTCRKLMEDFEKFMRSKYPDVVEMRRVAFSHVQEFVTGERFKGLSAGSYNIYIRTYQKIWEVLAANPENRIESNPWERLKCRRNIPVRRRELTLDELRRVCGSLSGGYRLLFAVGMYTGLRLTDCAHLVWSEVDMERRVIVCVPRKTKRSTGRAVTIPIHGELYAMLSCVPEQERRGLVIPECYRDHERGMITKRVQDIFKRNGIETHAKRENGKNAVVVGFHSLRHTFVSLCANAGVPLAMVQSMVGHSSANMTLHYFHENAQAMTAAISAIPSIGGTVATPEPTDAGKGRWSAFCEIVGGMTEEERQRAIEYLLRGQKGTKGVQTILDF